LAPDAVSGAAPPSFFLKLMQTSSLVRAANPSSTFWDSIEMKVQRDKMLSVDAAARSIFFAATQEGEGVMSEIIFVPESHQII
jgi:hypothetical protein